MCRGRLACLDMQHGFESWTPCHGLLVRAQDCNGYHLAALFLILVLPSSAMSDKSAFLASSSPHLHLWALVWMPGTRPWLQRSPCRKHATCLPSVAEMERSFFLPGSELRRRTTALQAWPSSACGLAHSHLVGLFCQDINDACSKTSFVLELAKVSLW